VTVNLYTLSAKINHVLM